MPLLRSSTIIRPQYYRYVAPNGANPVVSTERESAARSKWRGLEIVQSALAWRSAAS